MYVTGNIHLTTTPTQTFVLGFQPTWARVTVSGKAGDTVSHMSIGTTDGTNQTCNSTYADTTGGQSINSTTKMVSHWERVSGTLTEVLSASFNSFTSTGIKFNVATADNAYAVSIEAGN